MDTDLCVTKADFDYDVDGRDLVAIGCAEAIALADGREIFVIFPNNDIQLYNDGKCIELEDNAVLDGHGRVQTMDCSASSAPGDGRGKWLIHQNMRADK